MNTDEVWNCCQVSPHTLDTHTDTQRVFNQGHLWPCSLALAARKLTFAGAPGPWGAIPQRLIRS